MHRKSPPTNRTSIPPQRILIYASIMKPMAALQHTVTFVIQTYCTYLLLIFCSWFQSTLTVELCWCNLWARGLDKHRSLSIFSILNDYDNCKQSYTNKWCDSNWHNQSYLCSHCILILGCIRWWWWCIIFILCFYILAL